MNSEYGIDEGSLRPLFGRPVCVILEDDTRHTGILTSCGPSSIVLNGESAARPGKRARKSKVKGKVAASSFEEQTSPAACSSYWGTLDFGPPMEISSVKTVIPLAPVRAVFAL
ncbi:hypothetical protein D7Z26_05385 [Cohnella endophytica]|uniref:LSM domain-containing protein n=1 Tax=Cohnella endophytica TaxID=2419778 RepID=A0A494Y3Q8_9BACL|nr:hypothetical protein [Cohnella endophytica]RKP56085.1 hypothetical protein D7Z26_05385 [Cohnella endophytica]